MRAKCLTAALVAAALAGCGDDPPKEDLPPLHPVQGKVVRGGQPVGAGSLRFEADPPVPDVVVVGDVKADGTFELQTVHAKSSKVGAGAPAGTYTVSYTPAAGDRDLRAPGGMPEPETASQSYTVREGPNELTVDLGKR